MAKLYLVRVGPDQTVTVGPRWVDTLSAPIHVVMRYLGHTSPEMTLYYARTLEEVAERELLKTQVIGRDGRDLDLTRHEVADILGLSTRTDRVLPTGLCLLPPTKSCERGNACYSCLSSPPTSAT